MPALPRASLVALVLISTLAGCGDDSKSANSEPTPLAPATSESPAVAVSTPAVSASTSADPQTTPDAGCGATGTAVPDGTWHGPITVDMRGAGDNSGYPESRGTGQLTMTVRDGKVARGSWTLTWKSHGEVERGDAAATVDFTGTVSGTASGTAAIPALPHNWRIKGIARVSRPEQTSSPFDETGTGRVPMTIKPSTCAHVTATFVPVFNSKETAATFTGTAEWIGTRR